jgi:hypothetical protein
MIAMRRPLRWAGYATLLVASMATGSCRSPTEITLEVRTDAQCSDLQGISIAVGTLGDALESRPAASTSASCDPITGRIGALVVVPSGSNTDEVGIRVVAGFGKSVASCVAPWGEGCIVARRALRFIPHEPLSVPINLSASCDGVPCDATTTCVNGQCVPARIDSSTCASALGCDDDRLRPVPVFTGCGDVSGLQSSAPWPMAGGCPTRV